MKLDILAIVPHPDDAELGCGGVLIAAEKAGKKTGIIDLTKGELGTRGNSKIRQNESVSSASFLSLQVRKNLGMKDGFFENNKQSQLKIINVIRHYKPEIVITSGLNDRHPDHTKGAKLVEDCCFLSGLIKIKTYYNHKLQNSWRPRLILYCIQDVYQKPDVVVDISPYFEDKLKAIKFYRSQFFNPLSKEPKSYISAKSFLEIVETRARHFGYEIGTKYGEGFIKKRMVGVKDIFQIL